MGPGIAFTAISAEFFTILASNFVGLWYIRLYSFLTCTFLLRGPVWLSLSNARVGSVKVPRDSLVFLDYSGINSMFPFSRLAAMLLRAPVFSTRSF